MRPALGILLSAATVVAVPTLNYGGRGFHDNDPFAAEASLAPASPAPEPRANHNCVPCLLLVRLRLGLLLCPPPAPIRPWIAPHVSRSLHLARHRTAVFLTPLRAGTLLALRRPPAPGTR